MSKIILVLSAVAILQGCGSVSEMTGADGSEQPVLPVYPVAVVENFTDKTNLDSDDEETIREYREAVRVACSHFADIVASELRKNDLYQDVVRGQYEGEAVRIGGSITRYVEGNAAARFFVGLGAGSSYFDSTITFFDNVTDAYLGELVVDKNSWALGGGLASGQTVEKYMKGAANKLVEEILEARETMRVLKEAEERQAAGT